MWVYFTISKHNSRIFQWGFAFSTTMSFSLRWNSPKVLLLVYDSIYSSQTNITFTSNLSLGHTSIFIKSNYFTSLSGRYIHHTRYKEQNTKNTKLQQNYRKHSQDKLNNNWSVKYEVSWGYETTKTVSHSGKSSDATKNSIFPVGAQNFPSVHINLLLFTLTRHFLQIKILLLTIVMFENLKIVYLKLKYIMLSIFIGF